MGKKLYKINKLKFLNNNFNIQNPADFETAISATGFGWYNLLLILISIPSGWSTVFETTTMSYVFPAAQCDLELSLNDKGFLNAITYLGTITSALVWGFLFDTLGRKKLLCIGFFLDGCIVVISSFAQTKSFLIVTKFLGGFVINGPFAALMSYISEFHSAQYRAKMQLVLGTIFSFGTVFLPLLAWAILPQNIHFQFLNFEYHSWNVYLFISSFASLFSAFGFLFLPESPKFLMTTGRNDKALKIFQNVYSINTGKPSNTYPITELIDETKIETKNFQITANRSKSEALREGWQQMKPLFCPPHLKNLICICLIQMFIAMSLNTVRLWLPQIFQVINDYQYLNNATDSSFCQVVKIFQSTNVSSECVVNWNNDAVYIHSSIVSSITMISYVFAGLLINYVGKKNLLCTLSLISGISAYIIYFCNHIILIIIFCSSFLTSASIATNVTITILIDLFPTTLRTLTVSITMMIARLGAMTGNIIMPILLEAGCTYPLFSMGTLILLSGFLVLLLPNTDLKALE